MHERWVDCDGLWVHTVDWEPEPAATRPDRPPVVLVHGLGGSTVSWELVGPALAARLGARVTAIDLPGFGRTRCEDRPPSFRVHAQLLAAFLEPRGAAVLMGNSMGGALGVALAASRPELVHALVLVNAALPRPRGNLEQLMRTMRFAALLAPRAATPVVRARARALGPEGLVDSTLRFVLAHPEALDPEIRTHLVALATERHQYPESATAYTQSGGSLFRYLVGPMRRDLAAVHRPTLILHGRRDQLVPVGFARALAHQRGDWPFVELEGCGHVPQLEQPDRFVGTVCGWLERAGLSGARDRAAPA